MPDTVSKGNGVDITVACSHVVEHCPGQRPLWNASIADQGVCQDAFICAYQAFLGGDFQAFLRGNACRKLLVRWARCFAGVTDSSMCASCDTILAEPVPAETNTINLGTPLCTSCNLVLGASAPACQGPVAPVAGNWLPCPPGT